MIVWQGWGLLVGPIALLVTFGVAIPIQLLVESMGLSQALIPGGVSAGLILAAAVNWIVGKRLNDRPGRELVDRKTGETVILRPRHTLFFIKMEYWSIPMVLIAVLMLVLKLSEA